MRLLYRGHHAPGGCAVMAAARFSEAKRAHEFIVAGNAIVTLRSRKSGEHYTYRIRAPRELRVEGPNASTLVKWARNCGAGDATLRFVSVLGGPDNNGDYRYIGFIRDGRFYHGGERAKAAKEGSAQSAPGGHNDHCAAGRG